MNCLTKHISINSTGAGNPQNLFKVLVRAASKQDTIENTSKELKTATCGNNIRYHLRKISDFKQVENQLNLALKSKIPKGLKKKNLVIAIDHLNSELRIHKGLVRMYSEFRYKPRLLGRKRFGFGCKPNSKQVQRPTLNSQRRLVEVTSFEVSSKACPKGYRFAYDDRRRMYSEFEASRLDLNLIPYYGKPKSSEKPYI